MLYLEHIEVPEVIVVLVDKRKESCQLGPWKVGISDTVGL
jgi:hypothetical protein